MRESYRVCHLRTDPAAFEHFLRQRPPGFAVLRLSLARISWRYRLTGDLAGRVTDRVFPRALAPTCPESIPLATS